MQFHIFNFLLIYYKKNYFIFSIKKISETFQLCLDILAYNVGFVIPIFFTKSSSVKDNLNLCIFAVASNLVMVYYLFFYYFNSNITLTFIRVNSCLQIYFFYSYTLIIFYKSSVNCLSGTIFNFVPS